jgi:DNA-binding PadR family transcriptional regulator
MTPLNSNGEIDRLLPLRSVDFLVLLMLSQGERHGYGIMQDVAQHTEGATLLEAGSLYRTIRRLTEERLVVESGRRPSPELDDDRRRYYRLTPLGRRVVAAEAARLRRLVRLAEAAQLLPPDTGLVGAR